MVLMFSYTIEALRRLRLLIQHFRHALFNYYFNQVTHNMLFFCCGHNAVLFILFHAQKLCYFWSLLNCTLFLAICFVGCVLVFNQIKISSTLIFAKCRAQSDQWYPFKSRIKFIRNGNSDRNPIFVIPDAY